MATLYDNRLTPTEKDILKVALNTCINPNEIERWPHRPHYVFDTEHIIQFADCIREGGWQPIETAPRDGTPILGWFPKTEHVTWDRVVITHWRVDYGGYGLNPPHWSDGSVSGSPLHWMPLPKGPT